MAQEPARPYPSVESDFHERLQLAWTIAMTQCRVKYSVLEAFTGVSESTLKNWKQRGVPAPNQGWLFDALIQCAGKDADRVLNVWARPLGHEVAVRPEPSESGMQALTGKLAGDAGHAVQVLLSAFADGHVDAGELQAISESLRTLDEDVEQLKSDTGARLHVSRR